VKQLICAFLVLFSSVAYGQLFKCIDKSGHVEYASICPVGTNQETMEIRSAPPSGAATGAPQKSLAERDAAFRKRQIEQQEAQAKARKKAAEDKQRQQACDQTHAYLKSLQARNRVARTDPKTGQRVYLEEQDYVREIAKAQQSIQTNCK